MTKDRKSNTQIKRIEHVGRLRAHWNADMRRAFAKGRQVRENTAQLGRPSSAIGTESRNSPVFIKTLALAIGIPAVILLAAFSVRAIGGG